MPDHFIRSDEDRCLCSDSTAHQPDLRTRCDAAVCGSAGRFLPGGLVPDIHGNSVRGRQKARGNVEVRALSLCGSSKRWRASRTRRLREQCLCSPSLGPCAAQLELLAVLATCLLRFGFQSGPRLGQWVQFSLKPVLQAHLHLLT